MKYQDIKTKEDIIGFIETSEGLHRKNIPFYKERDLAILIRWLKKQDLKDKNLEVTEDILIYFAKKFIKSEKTSKENIQSMQYIFCPSISTDEYKSLILNLDSEYRILLGLKGTDIISCNNFEDEHKNNFYKKVFGYKVYRYEKVLFAIIVGYGIWYNYL